VAAHAEQARPCVVDAFALSPCYDVDRLPGCTGRAIRSASVIGFIVAGLIIGLLARLLLPGRQKIGLLWTLVLGILGSVVGGVIANLIGSGDIFELNVIGFTVAVLTSVALLAAAERSGLGAGNERKRLDRS